MMNLLLAIFASRADVKHSAYSQAMHSFYFCMLLVGGLSPKPHVMQSRLCGCKGYPRYSPLSLASEIARNPMAIVLSLHQWP